MRLSVSGGQKLPKRSASVPSLCKCEMLGWKSHADGRRRKPNGPTQQTRERRLVESETRTLKPCGDFGDQHLHRSSQTISDGAAIRHRCRTRNHRDPAKKKPAPYRPDSRPPSPAALKFAAKLTEQLAAKGGPFRDHAPNRHSALEAVAQGYSGQSRCMRPMVS